MLFTTSAAVQQLAYKADGSRLIAYEGGWLREWDLTLGKTASIMRLAGWPARVAFAARTDDFAFIIGTDIGWYQGIIASRAPTRSFMGVSALNLEAVALIPDGGLVAVAAARARGSFLFVGPPKGKFRHHWLSSVRISSLAFNLDGQLLASAGEGGFTLWDIAKGESILARSGPTTNHIAFTPNGKRIAFTAGNSVHFRDAITGDSIFVLEPNAGKPVADLAFSPDGRIVATAAGDMVHLWDADSGEPRQSFDWNIGRILAVAFSPDGLTAAAGSDRGQVVVWDVDE